MRYSIIGTGAIGGYYGGKLCKAGFPVAFLARSDYDHIRRHGLRVDSWKGDFVLPDVQVHNSAASLSASEVIVVATKTTSNPQLPELLRPIVRKGTIILLMQNGLGMEEELQAALPDAVIIGGMCFICSQKRGPGYIVHMDVGAVNAAPLNGKDLPLLDEIRKDFLSADIDFSISEDLGRARWKKLLWNIPFNGLSVVLKADTSGILGDPRGEKLARQLMEEVVTASEACGSPVGRDQIEKMIQATVKMTPYKPSMRLDFDTKREMEVHYMYRKPLEAAREKGLRLPGIEMLTDQLEFLNVSSYSR